MKDVVNKDARPISKLKSARTKWQTATTILFILLMIVSSKNLFAQSGVYSSNGGGSCGGSCDVCKKFVEESACTGFYTHKDPIWTRDDGVSCAVSKVCHACDKGGYYLGNGRCALTCPIGMTPNATGRCVQATTINNGSSTNNTCNPINIATGNKFFNHNDFTGSGINPLQLTRYFNSNTTDYFWTFSYRQSLLISSSEIQAKREDGKVILFTVNDGTITAPSHRVERLSLINNIYRLELPGNTVEEYNTQGQLTDIQYLNGEHLRVTYSDLNIDITLNNETLAYTLLNNTLDSPVANATLPDGSVINYSYDNVAGINRLLTVTYDTQGCTSAPGAECPGGTPTNFSKTYFYEDTRFSAYLTGLVDENGNRISTVQYDNQGRAISSEKGPLNSGIERTQIQYHDDGTRTLTNALGKKSKYHFTQFNGEYKMTLVEGEPTVNCAAANQAYTYDTNGFMASKTDWKGNVTTYIHNDRGQEISRTEASGTPQARTIATEWHSEFNLPTRIIEPERETVMKYNEERKLLSRQIQPGNN